VSGRRKSTQDKTDTSKTEPAGRREGRADSGENSETEALIRRHLRFGWWALLFFVLMGLFLETLHGFKVAWYLEASSTTRRHMWTLAHAHGTLLAVLNLVLASTIRLVPRWSPRPRHLASTCLLSAAVLLPGGFLLGGWFTHEGDPGLGIVLVPVGGILLVIAILLAARAYRRGS